jgi:glycosyltransferase involved in cell wall biosynthesis
MSRRKKKSILIVCPVFSPHAGGGGQYFPLLAKQLRSFSVVRRVVVLTERHPSRTLFSIEDDILIYRLLPQRDTQESKSLIFSIVTFFWTYLTFYISIPLIIIYHDVGVLHYTRYLRSGFYFLTKLMTFFFKTSIILDMRATVENDVCIKNLFGVNALISNSKAVYLQMKELGVSSKINFFVPNPVILPTPIPSFEAWNRIAIFSHKVKKPYLLFVGQLLDRKAILEVIDAFKKFSLERPEFSLVLAGRNMMGEPLERKIKQIPSVIQLGPISRDDVLALISGSELVLQPSRVEGIPRVSLETLALRKKILLPPCVPELIENNEKFTIPIINSNEIFKAIKRILECDSIPIYDLSVHDPKFSKSVLSKVYESVGY